MRVIVMGTPEFAVPALVALAAAHEVVAVYTQPPRPGGRRGRELTPSPAQRKAEELGIMVRSPVSLKGAAEQAEFAALQADIALVAAYGLILPRAILAAPRLGCLNLHGSLLPRWRGAAPIQRAILAGDTETGVDIMRMEAGLDTGAVLAEARTLIAAKNTGQLIDELAQLGAELIIRVLADPAQYPEVPQPAEGITYAHKIDKAEARLDFSATAEAVKRQIRAFAPSPGAFFELEGERYRILLGKMVEASGEPGVVLDDCLTIACGSGAIRPSLVQRAGRPAMDTAAMLRGRAIAMGTKLA